MWLQHFYGNGRQFEQVSAVWGLQSPVGMAGFRDFRDIVAWQLARDLKLLAYEVLSRPEAARDFKFRDQLSDAARSGPRNIAEGFARFKHKEFAQFARVAKGSEGRSAQSLHRRR